jgi:hypothetical protein
MNIRKVAKDYDIKLLFISDNNIDKYSIEYNIDKQCLYNNAYLLGDSIILLGIFKENEVRNAVFFHELGHTVINKAFEKLVHNDVMFIEYQAWIEGLKIAKKYNYIFSKQTFKHILKLLNTYYKTALSEYDNENK